MSTNQTVNQKTAESPIEPTHPLMPDLFNNTKIDANVITLLNVLNRLPGVITASSCGGHMHPKAGQCPRGEFFVAFYLDRTLSPSHVWESLECIRFVAQRCDLQLIVNTYIEYAYDAGQAYKPSGAVEFVLLGEENPEVVARQIKQAWDGAWQGCSQDPTPVHCH